LGKRRESRNTGEIKGGILYKNGCGQKTKRLPKTRCARIKKKKRAPRKEAVCWKVERKEGTSFGHMLNVLE